MSCNAKKDPNGTCRIQYRWTDWTGTKKKSQKRGFKTKKLFVIFILVQRKLNTYHICAEYFCKSAVQKT